MTARRRRRSSRGQRELSAEQIAALAHHTVGSVDSNDQEAQLQRLYLAQLQEELQGRERELCRLRELERDANAQSIANIRRLIEKAEAAVQVQEQRVKAYLEARPWLEAELEESDLWESEEEAERLEWHPSEPEWREQIMRIVQEKQAEWQDKLSSEQAEKIEQWRSAELAKLQSHYQKVEQELSERQALLEKRWSSQLQNIELKRLRELMDQESKEILASLRSEMEQRQQEIEQRAAQALLDFKAELAQQADRLLELQRKELHRMEIEWREQEVIQGAPPPAADVGRNGPGAKRAVRGHSRRDEPESAGKARGAVAAVVAGAGS
jgi:hypothetical protein